MNYSLDIKQHFPRTNISIWNMTAWQTITFEAEYNITCLLNRRHAITSSYLSRAAGKGEITTNCIFTQTNGQNQSNGHLGQLSFKFQVEAEYNITCLLNRSLHVIPIKDSEFKYQEILLYKNQCIYYNEYHKPYLKRFLGCPKERRTSEEISFNVQWLLFILI